MTKGAYKSFITDAHAEMKSLPRLSARSLPSTPAPPKSIKDWSQLPGATADYGRIAAASPMDMTPAQVQGLGRGAVRTPFSVEIMPKSYRDRYRRRQPSQNRPGWQLLRQPSAGAKSLYAVGLGYEPTRIADLLPGAAMPGPSATWLSHTANGAEVGIAAEGATKGDLPPTIPRTR